MHVGTKASKHNIGREGMERKEKTYTLGAQQDDVFHHLSRPRAWHHQWTYVRGTKVRRLCPRPGTMHMGHTGLCVLVSVPAFHYIHERLQRQLGGVILGHFSLRKHLRHGLQHTCPWREGRSDLPAGRIFSAKVEPTTPIETNRERSRFYRKDIDDRAGRHRCDGPGSVRHSQRRARSLRAALSTWKTRRWIGRDRSWLRSCTDGSSSSPRSSDSPSDTGKKTSRS